MHSAIPLRVAVLSAARLSRPHPTPIMHDKTLAELYRARHGLNADECVESLLHASLYPHARLLARWLRLIRPRHFAADYEFVMSVGCLRRFRDFPVEADEFAQHPDNRGLLRRTLNLRVSTRRLRRLARQTLHPELADGERPQDHSAAPFARAEESGASSCRPERETSS